MSDRTAKLTSAAFCLLVASGLGGGNQVFAEIRWRNHPERLGSTRRAAPPTTDELRAMVAAHANQHVIVRFGRPLAAQARTASEAAGLRLLGYLGDHAFFASIPVDPDIAAIVDIDSLVSVEPIRSVWKQHRAFAIGELPAWAVVDEADQGNPTIAAYVLFHADVPLVPDAVVTVERYGAFIQSYVRSVNGLVIHVPLGEIEALAREDAVQWIEPPIPPLGSANDSNRLVVQVEAVQAEYGLDGTGVTVLVYDGGVADERHPDVAGRLTPRDGSGVSSHSTHVAVTIGGDGFASGGLWRGMAPGVILESYGFEMPGGLQEGFLYTDPGDLEHDYDEAINLYGADLANNSIGTNVCSNGFDCEWTGDYGVTAQLIDSIVAGSLAGPFRVVWAAGNERACDRCRDEGVHTLQGYHSTAPPGGAKNHILIGAVNSNDESMTPFSSWGPTDDGRLKPDLVAPGCQVGDDFGVTSGNTLGGYVTACGTSMAAPTVTGASALLLQDFRNRFPERDDFRNSTLKALLAHNAADLEPPGPDYRSGYGAIRIKDTIDFMRTGNFLEAQVGQHEMCASLVEVDAGAPTLKATLAWDDVPGTPNVEPALVNDLDLRVYAPDGVRRFPWTLDPAEPDRAAERTRRDDVNNIEQIFVDAPQPGVWLVEVYGYHVPQGPQPFSLCISPRIPVDCDHDGTPDAEQLLLMPELDCGGDGNGILDVCEPDCDGDGVADSCQLAEGPGLDCNFNGLPDDCEPWLDCNDNGIYDPCDVCDGHSTDCNGDWVPDKCEPDCNGNCIADECDITGGTSADDDRDGIPDECQPFIDCNFNLISDRCEIAQGFTEDFNGNRIPDECELPNQTRYVDAVNCAEPGSGTLEDPFCRIQDAIDQSISGDEVVVAPGVYIGIGNRDLDFGGRRIALRGTDPADPAVIAGTVIDCDAKGRGLYFHSGETRQAVVEGLTIRNGLAALGSTPGSYVGAGVYCKDSHPTIRNCVLTEGIVGPVISYISGGGGIYCERSDATIENCTMTANFTYNHGGGIYCYDHSCPLIRNCTIMDNVSFNGGGIACGFESCPIIENCVIAYNTGGSGSVAAGITCYGMSDVTIRNCIILGNDCGAFGNVIQASYSSHLWLDGCTVVGNHGDPDAGVIYLYGSMASIHNSILWGNAGETDPLQIVLESSSGVSVDFCDIEGSQEAVDAGSGGHLEWYDSNIDADPLFMDEGGDDLRLTGNSPCVNGGDPSLEHDQGDTDVDGQERVQHCRVDIGAHESPFLVDCNSNTLSDACELIAGTVEDCDENAVPDECQDTTEDCNDNGVWDPCDIAYGAADCNGNHVPDECDIRDGTAADCNENDIPDVCDIASGTSEDVNGNDVPDSCEPCEQHEQCSDGVYCTGVELCIEGVCQAGNDPCPGQFCVEDTQICLDCVTDEDCDDGNECTINTCEEEGCTESYADGPCDDGEPCTQSDACVEGRCVGTIIPGCGSRLSIRAVRVNSAVIPGGPTDSITVTRGDRLTCEVFLENWAPALLYGYNVMIDPSGYASGLAGSLAPFVDPNPSAGAFIDVSHADFVFRGLPVITAVWNLEPTFYQYVGLVLYAEDCAVDPGRPMYLATLILTPSDRALGAFTVCLDDTDSDGDLDPDFCYLRDCEGWAIKPIEFGCVTIEVFADCNDNGVSDDQDILEGTSEDCTGNYVPDECEPDCNENEVADSCDIADGTSEDCNGNEVPDTCDTSDGTSEDCNGNTVPDECEPDCNDNGVADACDITEGTSPDCNDNEVPDECDLADGTSNDCDHNDVPDECQDTGDDCNGNDVWDWCDIFYGTSGDCNHNDRPDECDIDDGASADCDDDGVPDECPDLFPQPLDVSDLDGIAGLIIHGIREEDKSGRTVSGAGDVNGDGFDDVLIGAPDADSAGLPEAGEGYVLFGRPGLWTQPFELSNLMPQNGGTGTEGFIIGGLAGGDYTGDGLSSAGDFNGDGINDLLIGAPGADFDEEANVGRAYLVFGQPLIGAGGVVYLEDLDGTDGFAINGVEADDFTGHCVALAGDVNGDGLDDILISAHKAGVDGQAFVGRVYVLFGAPGPWPEAIELSSLLPDHGGDGSTGFVINGIDSGDFAGSSLGAAGDLNDDGFDDMILGAYSALGYIGQAYVVFGGPAVGAGGEIHLSDLDGDNGLIINGIDVLDLAGDSVAAAGDVNGDGVGDIMISAVWGDPHSQTDAGETYVIFGHAAPWPDVFDLSVLLLEHGGDGTAGFVINGIDPDDRSGFSTSGVGDIDDDGIDDIIVGAYLADPGGRSNAGEAYVLFGHPAPWPAFFDLSLLLDQDPLALPLGFVISGADPGDYLGQSIANAGDINHDGFPEVVIGAAKASPAEHDSAGASYVIFGRDVLPNDCNANGTLDECDIAEGTSEDCDGNDVPDECQDTPEDCNDNQVWDLCDIVKGTSEDCNDNMIPDECDVADGESPDCNENVIPDECEPTYPVDCNDNGVWDACDIHTEASGDCNMNAIPDECEPGGEEDCNDNDQPDLCDIFHGTSEDANFNGVPDECDAHDVIHVSTNTCNEATGGSGTEDDPFCRIQSAIDSAGDGTEAFIEVVVADGIYVGPGNQVLDLGGNLPEGRTRAIWVHSERGPTNCVIDCEGGPFGGAPHAFLFDRGEGPGACIEGFTIIDASRSAIECQENSNPTIRNCVLTYNLRNGSGAGIKCTGSSPTISHCLIAGNYVNGITCLENSNPTIVNCVIAGNHGAHGGGIHCFNTCAPIIKNCTIAHNVAAWDGGGIYAFASIPTVSNSIVWDNSPNDIKGTVDVAFSHIGSHDERREGNGNRDPLFVGGPSGVWSAGPQYDPQTRQATLMDETASWQDGEFVGCTVNVATTAEFQLEFVVVANTATTLTVWSDTAGLAAAGGEYRVFNYRLLSESPCVDAGDPAFVPGAKETDLDGHARVLCSRVDMGAYESGIGDYDCDRGVGLLDFASWSACLTGPEGGVYGDGCEVFDADFDHDVDLPDLAAFQLVFAGS